MKTVFISGSPKKSRSASEYFMNLQKVFVKGQIVTERLRTKGDWQRILQQIETADAVVFFVPLYVDSVPSHVLAFLMELEKFCREKKPGLHVYAVANNGFIEGKQNEPLFRVLENFCIRSEAKWCGGLGIGGGVMLHAMKYVFWAAAVTAALMSLLSGILSERWLLDSVAAGFAITAAVILFLNSGVLFQMARQGKRITQRRASDSRYTRILLPSFVFILFADVYFLMVSILKGGAFRGWLRKK